MPKKGGFCILLLFILLITLSNGEEALANGNYNTALNLLQQAERHAGALKWAVSFEGSADGRTRPGALYAQTRTAWMDAQAAINRLTGSQKQTLQKRLDANVTEYVERAMRYNDTVVAGGRLDERRKALENELSRSIIDEKTKLAYDQFLHQLSKFAQLCSLVYGKSTRVTLRQMYEDPAVITRNEAIYPVNLFVETGRFETSIANGNLELAEIRYKNIETWLPLVTKESFIEQFTKRFDELKIPFQQLKDSQYGNPEIPSIPPDTDIVTGVVHSGPLNVRANPNTTSPILGQLAVGASVSIVETSGDWHKIIFNGSIAYVHKDYVTITENSAPKTFRTGVVQSGPLNIRANPGTTSQILGQLSVGESVIIVETTGNWHKIVFGDTFAYVHKEYVTDVPIPIRTGVVHLGPLNIRTNPTTSSQQLGSFNVGTTIQILETIGNWHKIIFNGSIAYVHKGSVTENKPTTAYNKIIVIDPGHGGSDPGATYFGINEKDIVLAVSLILEKKLKSSGYQVVMTRNNDTAISLENRVLVANTVKPDMYISIHANAAVQASANGTETFWDGTYEGQESRRLAELLQTELVTKLQTRYRRVAETGFYVLRNTEVPSALVELGFVSNEQEVQRMITPKFQEDAAEALLQGILKYYKN